MGMALWWRGYFATGGGGWQCLGGEASGRPAHALLRLTASDTGRLEADPYEVPRIWDFVFEGSSYGVAHRIVRTSAVGCVGSTH